MVCGGGGQTFVAAPATEVVPPPSVCSTAVGPPRRTSPLPGRRLPLVRTLVPRSVDVCGVAEAGEVCTHLDEGWSFLSF